MSEIIGIKPRPAQHGCRMLVHESPPCNIPLFCAHAEFGSFAVSTAVGADAAGWIHGTSARPASHLQKIYITSEAPERGQRFFRNVRQSDMPRCSIQRRSWRCVRTCCPSLPEANDRFDLAF